MGPTEAINCRQCGAMVFFLFLFLWYGLGLMLSWLKAAPGNMLCYRAVLHPPWNNIKDVALNQVSKDDHSIDAH